MQSQIGASAVVIVDGQDISRFSRTIRYTSLLSAIQETKFQPRGMSHSFISGLRGGAVGFSGDIPVTEDGVLPELQGSFANPRDPHIIYIAPSGDAPGYLARIGKSLQNQFSSEVPFDGLIGFSADFEKTAGSPGVLSGVSLWSSRGASSYTANEVQTLTFTNVPALQQLALRKINTTVLGTVFHASDTTTTMKARVEELYGTTATVTGSLSSSTDGVTGETLYSGTWTITFSGNAAGINQTQMEVVSGEVQTATIAGAFTSGTYNAAALALGASAATFQAALRVTGGNYANVVVAGSSA